MNLADLACAVFEKAESLEVPHMVVGAIAAGTYGIPRATKDIDLLVSVDVGKGVHQLMNGLDPLVEFEGQAQFDTITWDGAMWGRIGEFLLSRWNCLKCLKTLLWCRNSNGE